MGVWSVLWFLPVLVAGIFAFYSFGLAIIAIRAKERFRDHLVEIAKTNKRLQELRNKAIKLGVNDGLIVDLRVELETISSLILSETDRVYIKRGMFQKSKAGERRYIADLLAIY